MTGPCNAQAYQGVRLSTHNAGVGAAVSELFKSRLGNLGSRSIAEPLDKAVGWRGGSLLQASILAGALHDLGKSSPIYPIKRSGGKASYRGHELAGAVVIHRAAMELRRRRMVRQALLLELAAWAVARHHSAMKNRHPVDLRGYIGGAWSTRGESGWRGSEWLRQLIDSGLEALQGLAENPECASSGIPEALRGSWVERALIEAAAKLGGTLDAWRRQSVGGVLRRILSQALIELSTYPDWFDDLIPSGRWAALVFIASGAVIVADTLVSGAEGRETDEGVAPSYVEWWRREFGVEALELAKTLARDPSEAERVLGEALEPTLRLSG